MGKKIVVCYGKYCSLQECSPVRLLARFRRKNAESFILNTLRDERAGFESDTNKISIFGKDGSEIDFSLQSNKQLLLKL